MKCLLNLALHYLLLFQDLTTFSVPRGMHANELLWCFWSKAIYYYHTSSCIKSVFYLYSTKDVEEINVTS